MPPRYGQTLAEQVGSQAAGGAVEGLTGLVFGGIQNKRQIKQQKKLNELQYQQHMRIWNDTNVGAQMAHFKDAGLNPALMYEGTGGGGTTPTGGSQADPNVGMGMARGQNALTTAQIELMKAQTEKTKAEAVKTAGVDTTLANTQNTVLETKNELDKLDLKMNKETLMDRINEIASRSIEQQEKGVIAGQQREIGDNTVQDRITQIRQEAINTAIEAEVMKQGIRLSKAEVNKMSQDIAQNWDKLKQGWGMLTEEQKRTGIQKLMATEQKDDDQIINIINGIVNGLILKRFLGGSRPPEVKGFGRGNKSY